MTEARPQPRPRSAYKTFRTTGPRRTDNDAYRHVNNAVYDRWVDTVVNAHLIEHEALDIRDGEIFGLVIDTPCNYFAPVEFPLAVEAGQRLARIGRSSVR